MGWTVQNLTMPVCTANYTRIHDWYYHNIVIITIISSTYITVYFQRAKKRIQLFLSIGGKVISYEIVHNTIPLYPGVSPAQVSQRWDPIQGRHWARTWKSKQYCQISTRTKVTSMIPVKKQCYLKELSTYKILKEKQSKKKNREKRSSDILSKRWSSHLYELTQGNMKTSNWWQLMLIICVTNERQTQGNENYN